jgi:alpha-ketoglutarate-dependent taurine dioxygenase
MEATQIQSFFLICQIAELPKCKKSQPYDKIFETRKETFSIARARTQPSFNHGERTLHRAFMQACSDN